MCAAVGGAIHRRSIALLFIAQRIGFA